MKEKKGITLIALVVTIIVLVILAAVSLNAIIGNNGIINEAQHAKEVYEKSALKEKINLAIGTVQMQIDREPTVLLDLYRELKKDSALEVKQKTDGTLEVNDMFIVHPDFSITEKEHKEEIVESTSSLWQFDSTTQTVIQYIGSDIATVEKLTIPNRIDGVEVKKIGDGHNSVVPGANALKSVRIPNGIEKINMCAFYEAGSIEEVTMGDTVKIIDAAAFYDCSKLSKVILSNQLERMEESAFEGTLSRSLILPASLTYIGDFNYSSLQEDIIVDIIALGNPNGNYYIQNKSSYQMWANGRVNFINEDAFLISCAYFANGGDTVPTEEEREMGSGYNVDHGMTLFQLNREKREAYVVSMLTDSGSSGLCLPSQVDGCKVVSIEDNAELVFSVMIPKTITHFGKNAFGYNCVINLEGDYQSLEELKNIVVKKPIGRDVIAVEIDSLGINYLELEEFLAYCTVIE